MDTAKKKELRDSYKSNQATGGIICIRCSGSNREWIQSTRNLEGFKNRFSFAMKTKSCPDPSMRREWTEYGCDSFSLTVLEELKKKEDQTDKEFADDLNVLYDLWLEKAGRR